MQSLRRLSVFQLEHGNARGDHHFERTARGVPSGLGEPLQRSALQEPRGLGTEHRGTGIDPRPVQVRLRSLALVGAGTGHRHRQAHSPQLLEGGCGDAQRADPERLRRVRARAGDDLPGRRLDAHARQDDREQQLRVRVSLKAAGLRPRATVHPRARSGGGR